MTDPKDIVVYLDSTDAQENAQRLSYAARLAKQWDAHVAVAFVPEDLALDPHIGFARGAAIASALDAHKERREQSEREMRALLEEIRVRFDVLWELRSCAGEIGESLMLHARHAAIAILGSRRRPERQVSALTLSEDVIFASGRPSILLPAQWPTDRGIDKIVVGWNGSREAARAISDAMPFLKAAKQVHVVVVTEAKIGRLLGQDPGTDISRHLARHGLSVVLEQLNGPDAGGLLLETAHKIDADMIVIGAYGQPKISEFVFGSATQALLADSEIPLLLSR